MALKLKLISLSNRGLILDWFIQAKFRQDLQHFIPATEHVISLEEKLAQSST